MYKNFRLSYSVYKDDRQKATRPEGVLRLYWACSLVRNCFIWEDDGDDGPS